jgi:ABC-type transporter Mla maintaining outer membrane lipid asymmetry ATPase subunit MlaF
VRHGAHFGSIIGTSGRDTVVRKRMPASMSETMARRSSALARGLASLAFQALEFVRRRLRA